MQQRFGIRRNLLSVVYATSVAASLLAVSYASAGIVSSSTKPSDPPVASKFRVGRITAPQIPESSGIVASRKHAGVFWTHNDSDNPPSLFAITRDGQLIREYPVEAKNVDWEDIALDDAGHLFIADMGNNRRKRTEVQVYRVDEPDPRQPIHGRVPSLRVTRSWRLMYPDAPFDCESLFVWKGKGYVLPKRLSKSPAELLSFDLDSPARVQTLKKVAEIPVMRAPVTAADISADGNRLAILTLAGPYIFDINGDVESVGRATARYSRYFDLHIEAVCFVPEGLLVTNEGRDVFLFRNEDFVEVNR